MSDGKPVVHLLAIVDGISEETIEVAAFQSFPKQEFMLQFDVDPKRDPNMLDRYSVGPDDVPFLERFLEAPISFDFTRFAYFIEVALDDSATTSK